MKKQILFLFISIAWLTQAQTTYNDTVRTNRWSTQLQLGISNYANMRGDQYIGHRKAAPIVSLGVAYNLNALLRFDFNIGYSYWYCSSHSKLGVLPHSNLTGLMPYTDRNTTHLLFSDINAAVNLMEIYHARKLQRLNVWLSIGLGLTHGWNSHEQDWEMNNNWAEIKSHNTQANTIHFPLSLAAEYDIMPEVTIGMTAQYRAMPRNSTHTPKSMWQAALTLRYNFGIQHIDNSNMIMQKLIESYRDQAQYRSMLQQVADSNTNLINQQVALRDSNQLLLHENDSLVDIIIDLRDERSRLRQQVAEMRPVTHPTPTASATPTDTVVPIKQTTTIEETKSTTDKEEVKVSPSTFTDTCVYFGVSSSKISEAGMNTLRAVSNLLKANRRKKIFIIGYASSTGNADYNLRLSQDRIYAVRKTLIRMGVQPNQILGDRANGKKNTGASANNRKVRILIKN